MGEGKSAVQFFFPYSSNVKVFEKMSEFLKSLAVLAQPLFKKMSDFFRSLMLARPHF